VLDADKEDGLDKLQQVWKQLDAGGIPSHLESSRRGGHLWTFLDSPLPGAGARRVIQAVVEDLDELELYPKQDQLTPTRQVGSLVRGPLGIHRLSGARYPFVDPISLVPVASTVATTIEYLERAAKLSFDKAAQIVTSHSLKQGLPEPTISVPRAGAAPLARISPIEQAKQRIGDPYQFLSRFVELDASGKAHCPFHPPDYHPSFALNRATGRWTDFHEYDPQSRRYASGDVIDFYMRINGIGDYRQALDELDGMI
jgi:hypothetical protein